VCCAWALAAAVRASRLIATDVNASQVASARHCWTAGVSDLLI
jgi:hypothetical protein